MGIKEIREDILRSKKKEAEAITEDGKKEAAKLLSAADAELQSYEKRAKEHEDRIIGDYENKQTATVKFQVKRQRFNLEKRLLDEVMAMTTGKLSDLPEAERKRHIETMLKEIGKQFEIGKVYTNKKDISLVKKWKAEPVDILGGVIAENADGTQRIDYSYNTMLKTVFENQNAKIAEQLFK